MVVKKGGISCCKGAPTPDRIYLSRGCGGMADAPDLGSGVLGRESSSLSIPTQVPLLLLWIVDKLKREYCWIQYSPRGLSSVG